MENVPVGSCGSLSNSDDTRKTGGGISTRTRTRRNATRTVTQQSLLAQARLQSMAPTSKALILLNNNNNNQGSLRVKSSVGFEKSRNFRAQVERAIREHKIYSCAGVYSAVRTALLARGWVEKCPSLGIVKSAKEMECCGNDNETDEMWLSRVLKDQLPSFIWVLQRNSIEWRNLNKDQMINRFPKPSFTTKVGIAACLQNMPWFRESGLSDTYFPRCYRLCTDEDRTAFLEDYRLTACTSLLKWLVENYEKEGERGVTHPASRVGSVCVDFAIGQVSNYARQRRHEDIDSLIPPNQMTQIWHVFLTQYFHVVSFKNKLAPTPTHDWVKLKYEASKRALKQISILLPQHTEIDGLNNIWIAKPSARSRGKGIVILNQLDKILDLVNQSNARELNWVVQKYIERPLLIYKTKFDIRQWFIVSDFQPLTLWFYKECYIRFCTKPFSLEDFHESLHLCNNAVQCRYENSETRDPSLPQENMWDNHTLASFLKTQGHAPDLWETKIYPAMKQGILGVLLASQESNEIRKNSFELYGADFLLTQDLRPWLIEINSCPCMAPTSTVTRRMCAQCLEDVIKVVIDRRVDPKADTGLFELIYKQNLSGNQTPFICGSGVVIQGRKLLPDPHSSTDTTNNLDSKYYSNPQVERNGMNRNELSAEEEELTFNHLIHRLRRDEAKQAESPQDQLPTHSAPPQTPILIPGLNNSTNPRPGSKPKQRTTDGAKSQTPQTPLIKTSQDQHQNNKPTENHNQENKSRTDTPAPRSNSHSSGKRWKDESESTSSLFLVNSIQNQPSDLANPNRKSLDSQNEENAQGEASPNVGRRSGKKSSHTNTNNISSNATTKIRSKGPGNLRSSSKTNSKIKWQK